MDLVRVSHVHVGAVLKDVVVDHVNVGVGDGGAPVAGLVRAGQAAARVGIELGGGGLVVGAGVLVLGAQVPVHVDWAPAPLRSLVGLCTVEARNVLGGWAAHMPWDW